MAFATLVLNRKLCTATTPEGYSLAWAPWRSACGRFRGVRMTITAPAGWARAVCAPHLELALERAANIARQHATDAREAAARTAGAGHRLGITSQITVR